MDMFVLDDRRTPDVLERVAPPTGLPGTTDTLLHDVEAAIALGYRDVRVELDRLRFCDLAGLDALLAAKNRVERAGGALTLSPHTCWSLTLLLRVLRRSDQLEPLAAS